MGGGRFGERRSETRMVGAGGRRQRSGGHCSRRYRESAEGRMMPYSIPAPTAAKKAAGTAYAVAAKAS